MESDGDDKDESSTNLHHQHETPSQAIRSYECTFCRRGFSNAQALGGHMNIHRKHKAKLKLKLSPTSSSTTHHRQQQQLHQISHPPKTSYSPNTPTKPSSWPWSVAPYKEHAGDDDDQDRTSVTSDRQKESENLDLELRLGPEPDKDSSPTKGTTRKFF